MGAEHENKQNKQSKLVEVVLDEKTIERVDADLEHEREVAIFDLVEENQFRPCKHTVKENVEYKLTIELVERQLALTIKDTKSEFTISHILSLSTLRKIVKDYFLICESYYQSIRRETPSRIETIDMARRGLHDEGARVLQEQLKEKIEIDFDTARRLFTLICVIRKRT